MIMLAVNRVHSSARWTRSGLAPFAPLTHTERARQARRTRETASRARWVPPRPRGARAGAIAPATQNLRGRMAGRARRALAARTRTSPARQRVWAARRAST